VRSANIQAAYSVSHVSYRLVTPSSKQLSSTHSSKLTIAMQTNNSPKRSIRVNLASHNLRQPLALVA